MNGVVLCVLVVLHRLGGVDAPARAAAGARRRHARDRGARASLVNVFVALRLREHQTHSLNLRGAYLHVLSDLLGSIGAVVAAACHPRDRVERRRLRW